MKLSIEVAERLKEIREQNASNPRQFALSHKFNPSVWLRVEKAQTGIPDPYLATIVDTYGIDLNWLLTGKGEMNINNETKPVAGQPQTKTPAPDEAGDTKLELNEALTRALIRSQEEMIEANKAHRKLTDALLDERERWRDVELRPQVTKQDLRANLEVLNKKMDLNFRHDEMVDAFLLHQIAGLKKGVTYEDLKEDLHNVLKGDPIGQSSDKSDVQGSLSKA